MTLYEVANHFYEYQIFLSSNNFLCFIYNKEKGSQYLFLNPLILYYQVMKEQVTEQYQTKKIIDHINQVVINVNKQSDLFSKAFLKPIQVALKTWKTQNKYNCQSRPRSSLVGASGQTQSQLPQPQHLDGLPSGLYQVIKQNISQNEFTLQNFQSYQQIKTNQKQQTHQPPYSYINNLISLLKSHRGKKIKVCICICMYSQDKVLLRKTLAGVSRNIETFVHNGISTDQIVVCVVQDGIEKVDRSVIDFIGQLEKQSGIYLQNDTQPLTISEIIANLENPHHLQSQNANNFIFSPSQHLDRRSRRFQSVLSALSSKKSLLSTISKLKIKPNLTYSDLPSETLPHFLSQGRKMLQYKQYQLEYLKLFQSQLYWKYENKFKDIGDFEVNVDAFGLEQLQNFFQVNKEAMRKLLPQVLKVAQQDCLNYIQSREDLALLTCFRVDFGIGNFMSRADPNDTQQLLVQPHTQCPINLLFLSKYKNGGKLSSHNWFFNGLCRQIQSQYAILLDVGLNPDQQALYKMVSYMENNEKCGGVCGYMNLRIEKQQEEEKEYLRNIGWLSRIMVSVMDIQRVQQVQYHLAHLIDKPFQALFKFIHVLPGAYSGYRMDALSPPEEQGTKQQKNISQIQIIPSKSRSQSRRQDSKLMREYFKSLDQSISQNPRPSPYTPIQTILRVMLPDFLYYCCYRRSAILGYQQLLYKKNVYFAQDRTLCLGIHQNGYTLDYLPDAHAWVDPIKNLHGLMGQRKRWINGSFFAFQEVKHELIYGNTAESSGNRSKWGCFGTCCLQLQILYFALMNILGFVSPSFFLFAAHNVLFVIRDWFFGVIIYSNTVSTNFQTNQFYNSFVYVLDLLLIFMFFALIFKSMHFTHRTTHFLPFIYMVSTILGLFSLLIFAIMLYDIIQGLIDSFKCLSVSSSFESLSCSITYLVQNPALRQKFFKALPGGIYVFFIYKWIVVAIIGLYFVPVIVYCVFYCQWRFVADIILGVFSFVYYTPTYVNLLTTFALCRIDDISWGTKGLDSNISQNKQAIQTWKKIKIIHVAKYIFWNTIISTTLLIISSPIYLQNNLISYTTQNKTQQQIAALAALKQQQLNNITIDTYVRRFYLAFGFIVLVFLLLFVKVFFGAVYSVLYRCGQACGGNAGNIERRQDSSQMVNQNGNKNRKFQSKVRGFYDGIRESMLKNLNDNIVSQINKYRQSKNVLNMMTRSIIKKQQKKSPFEKLKQKLLLPPKNSTSQSIFGAQNNIFPINPEPRHKKLQPIPNSTNQNPNKNKEQNGNGPERLNNNHENSSKKLLSGMVIEKGHQKINYQKQIPIQKKIEQKKGWFL